MTKVEALNTIIKKLAPDTAGGNTTAECLGILTDIYAGEPQARQREISRALEALGMVLPAPGSGIDSDTVEYLRQVGLEYDRPAVNGHGNQHIVDLSTLTNLKDISIIGGYKKGTYNDAPLQIRLEKDKMGWSPNGNAIISMFNKPENNPMSIYIPGDLFTGTTNKEIGLIGRDTAGDGITIVVDAQTLDLSGIKWGMDNLEFVTIFNKVVGHLSDKIEGIIQISQDHAGDVPQFEETLMAKGWTIELVE